MIQAIIVFLNVALKYIMVDTRKEDELLYYAILAVISILCLTVVFIDFKYSKLTKLSNMSALVLPISIIILVCLCFSQDINFILPFMLALTFINTDYNKIIKYFFVSSMICFCVHIFLFIIGVLDDPDIMYRTVSDGSVLTRSFLGFEHPNNAFMFLLPIILCGYYFVQNFIQKLIFVSISFFISLIIFFKTNSRTGFILIILILLISLINESWIKRRKILLFIGRFMFFIMSIISIGISILCGKEITNKVNELLSGRPYIWHTYLNDKVRLIPTPGKIGLEESQIVDQFGQSIDNYYIYFLVRYGIILFIIIGIIYYAFFKNLQKNGQIKLYVITIFYFIYGMVETNTILVSINFVLIFIFSIYFNKNYFDKNYSKKTDKNLESAKIEGLKYNKKM